MAWPSDKSVLRWQLDLILCHLKSRRVSVYAETHILNISDIISNSFNLLKAEETFLVLNRL